MGSPESRTFLVHVGLPKTASTTLQLQFFDPHPEMVSIHHLSKVAELRELADWAMADLKGGQSAPSRREASLTDLAAHIEASPCTVLSNEGLTSNGTRPWPGKHDDLERFLGELGQRVEARRLALLMYRPAQAYLWSSYSHRAVHQPDNLTSFPEWVKRNIRLARQGRGELLVGDMVARLAAMLGPQHVAAAPLSHLADDPHGFGRALCEFAGVPADRRVLKKLSARRRNVTADKFERFPGLEERLAAEQKTPLPEALTQEVAAIQCSQLEKLEASGVVRLG